MEPKLQRRVQRYGWDLAAPDYEALWSQQLAPAQAALLAEADLGPGERVLDIACGTGLVAIPAAAAVGPQGAVLGVDLSARMIETAAARAQALGQANLSFQRMDAEALAIPDGAYDAALCALGLMYVPDPEQALREMRRVLRPGGRVALAIWGRRSRCGWSPVFEIVDAEVASEVCPLFFRLGEGDALAEACRAAGFEALSHLRIAATLAYADADLACDAAFAGGPVALAWSRFDADTRARARARYADAISPFLGPGGYALPGEFVVVAARAPG